MRINRLLLSVLFVQLSVGAMADLPAPTTEDGWISLFDGKTLDGWKVNENPETFSVDDGAIVVNGDRSHLFYAGDVNRHDFKNLELNMEVMNFPGSRQVERRVGTERDGTGR